MSEIVAPRAEEPALEGSLLARSIYRWVSRVTLILRGGEPLRLAPYAIAALPPATAWKYHAVLVTDDAAGLTLAWSDGTAWLRAYDNTEVST